MKTYWADNYNVKVDDTIEKLHFKSVCEVMSGVEKILKAFPSSTRYLKEFSLLEKGLMSTIRQKVIINFNPQYFIDAENVISTISAGIQNGFYPKNMTLEGVGAHEAGHILEDWLIAKQGGTAEDVKSRIFAENLIKSAYVNLMQTFQTVKEFKTLNQLRKEIANYATKNMSECLATAVSDYIINQNQAAILSKAIWVKLKEECD